MADQAADAASSARSSGPAEDHLAEITANRRLNLQEQFAQYESLRSWPLHVAIPTGDRCNLRCVFCTDRSPSADWYTDATFEGFLRFVEPVRKASLVQLYGWGEPFVNRAYGKMFDYVTNNFPGTRLYISTNGVLLNERWAKKIIDYGKCLVNISLNAATAETHRAIAGFDVFARIVANVRRLVRLRATRQVRDLVITLSFTATRINMAEFPRFIALSARLGIDYVVLQDLTLLEESHRALYLGNTPDLAREAFLKGSELALEKGIYLDSFMHIPGIHFLRDRTESAAYELPRDCLAVWHQDDDAPFQPQAGECYEPWMTFMMSQNGVVATCCRARESMGNLNQQSFQEIWNGDLYRTYRRTINTFRPPEACRSCPVKTGHDIR